MTRTASRNLRACRLILLCVGISGCASSPVTTCVDESTWNGDDTLSKTEQETRYHEGLARDYRSMKNDDQATNESSKATEIRKEVAKQEADDSDWLFAFLFAFLETDDCSDHE